MQPVTKENALTSQIFFHKVLKNKSGIRGPLTARRNGKTKTWKTRPDEFKVPVKYGLRECFYITNLNAAEWVVAD